MYAIVDIETTGSNTENGKVIEVAAYITDGCQIIDSYSTLINPEVNIPIWISGLTGIDNSMVANAPVFSEICEELSLFLKDKVFVAHNVNFDYGFLKAEFERECISFNPKKLCTVRLARKIFPGFRSYSLGRLCEHIGIPINDRHRAKGDAEATVQLFHLLVENDKNNEIVKSLKKGGKEQLLPPNLSKEIYDQLPSTTGIYFFHNEHGKIIYVGKAENIKKRVTGHFASGSESRKKQDLFNSIYDITYEECGNELIALIREVEEIKKSWPKFNSESKKPGYLYGLYLYEDQTGYYRLSFGKLDIKQKPVHQFRSALDARNWLKEKAGSFNLCEKMCNLRKENCLGCETNCRFSSVESYNLSVLSTLEELKTKKCFAIKGKGRDFEETGFVLVENGILSGYGFIPSNEQVLCRDTISPYLRKTGDFPEIHKILNGWLKKEKAENIKFFQSGETN